jgi:hypothetical protein
MRNARREAKIHHHLQTRGDLHSGGVASWRTAPGHVRVRPIEENLGVGTAGLWSSTWTREAAGCTTVPGGTSTGVGTAKATRALEEVSAKSRPASYGVILSPGTESEPVAFSEGKFCARSGQGGSFLAVSQVRALRAGNQRLRSRRF